jgi:sensor domain CHASE-containing protein
VLRRNMKAMVHRASATPHLEQNPASAVARPVTATSRRIQMNGIIYLVGLVVIVLAILSFLGLG